MEVPPAVRPVEILLVEDSPADVRLIKEALKEGKIFNTLTVVEDGVEALAFLKRERRYAQAARPDLILLDLNLPRKDGREVLEVIKHDPELKQIPVVILTASNSGKDIVKSRELHADYYVTKPFDWEQFIILLRSAGDFWLTALALPQTS